MGRTKLVAVVGTAAVLLAACSSSKGTSSRSSNPSLLRSSIPSATSPGAVSSSPADAGSSPSSSAPVGSRSAAQPGLSGRWKGSYTGAYSGTFALRWTQSTSKLTGTINLSSDPGALTINGTVAGGRIQFGTVGSQAITYTGSVAGNSMSGRYEVAGGAGGSGTWSATRS